MYPEYYYRMLPYTPYLQQNMVNPYPLYSHYESSSMNQQTLRTNARQQQLDPTMFMESAQNSNGLLNDANKIVQKISTDWSFAQQIMTAARQSNFDKVDSLIASIGITRSVETWFNPDGIRIEIPTDDALPGKSSLTIALQWQSFPNYV